MNETELKKLIEDCCNDIFDRLEPLSNVKSRLYQTLKPAINFTRCCKAKRTLIAFAEWKEYSGKWQTHEEQVKNFLKEYKSD